MMQKHLFLDMDGTLLDRRGRVSLSNAAGIKKAQLPITLVSARAPIEMKEAIDALDLAGPQIGFNGGLIYQYHQNQLETIAELPLPKQAGQLLINHIQQTYPELSQSYYYKDKWLSFKKDDGINYESQLTLLEPELVSLSSYLSPTEPLFKIMLITFDDLEMQNLKENLLQLQLEGVSIQQSGSYYLEITHQEAVKSRGIDYIMTALKLPKEATVAFGDGHNDLPMFAKVGTSIAMANAHLDVLRQATFVTTTNDKDGVAHGIWKYVKGNQ